ncbi:MAG TPA: toll/interleukin-1 receptor domain-containing protein [Verrucomicrobiae bacterium]|nr:toll/interleukin-1 receptor domain-containing protein [Verrucomicrobiae bacterium]
MRAKQKRRAVPREIFLSHASGDRDFADKLAQTLRKRGIAVWYSRTHLRGAQQWQAEIGRALRRCDWFMVILSPKSVRSMWVKRELSYALIQKRFQDKIVPVIYRKCNYEQLHWTLASFQMVDLTGGYTIGCRSLLKTWRR